MKPVARFSARLILLISLLLSSCASAQESRKTVPAQERTAAASSRSVISIPVEAAPYLGIFLQVRVNGSEPLWFVLDSGASSPLKIDTRRAEALGLKLQGKGQGRGAGEGTYEVRFAQGVSINLASVEFPEQTVATIPLAPLEPFAGRSIDGLLGYDLFNRFVVEIDYEAQTVNLYEPQDYKYSGTGESLPLEVIGNLLHVFAKVKMPGRAPFEGRFVVDTGAGPITVILNSHFVESHKLLPSTKKMILDRSLPGLGGETKRLVSRAQTFQLGRFVIREPVIDLSRDKGGALASTDFDGLIGGELLRRFKVIFDVPHRRLILEPGPHFAEPYEYNMSGIGLRAEGQDFKTFKVHRIIENSPAAKAGLREGDEIITVDGKPARTFTLDQLYNLFKQEGRGYLFEIARGSERLSVRIKLRRLV